MYEKLFKQLEGEVLGILINGRPNWDIPHTLASVYYMKQLLKNEKADLAPLKGYAKASRKILISTMYLHDVGYSDILGDLNNHRIVVGVKKDHMKSGIIIAGPILEKLDYSKNEIRQILDLIGCHDDLDDLGDDDKQLVFEADSLGQIDIDRARSNLKGADLKRFIEYFEKLRVPKFKTQIGRKYLNELFKKAKEFYLKNNG